MMTLIIRENEFNLYAGQVSKRFSTCLMPKLYSNDSKDNKEAIQKIIEDYELAQFDNQHQDDIISLDSYGIYFIDLPNKIIMTNDNYGDIKSLLLTEFSLKLLPNVLTNDKEDFFSSVKEMLEKDYLLATKEQKTILFNGIQTFFDKTTTKEFVLDLEEKLNANMDIALNEEKIGWEITQEGIDDLDFYKKLFNYFYDNNITVNELERENIIYNLKQEILDMAEDPDEMEAEIDNLFIKIESQKEKEYLETKVNYGDNIEENKKMKL